MGEAQRGGEHRVWAGPKPIRPDRFVRVGILRKGVRDSELASAITRESIWLGGRWPAILSVPHPVAGANGMGHPRLQARCALAGLAVGVWRDPLDELPVSAAA